MVEKGGVNEPDGRDMGLDLMPKLQALAAAALYKEPSSFVQNPYNHINCVSAASEFFSNIRTPAALLIVPAMNSLWVDLSTTTTRSKHPIAQTIYTMLAMCTILLNLVCVFIATVAGTRLMSGGFDPMASDAVTMLVRQFELPYLATHLSFLFGLVSFMSSVGLRAWIQFGDNMSPKIGKALIILAGTFLANMMAFFHRSITRFHLGLPGLLTRFVLLYLQEFGFLGFCSLCAIGVCLIFAGQVVSEQLHQHGAPTAGLSVDALPQVDPRGRLIPNIPPPRIKSA